ncbi:hypothetical protein GOY07_03815 [Wolbachia endosymbiont of Litomosoides sigmodontis]|uniref:hypothetical protein n=1 Tax=Wolbachia endosymbiont of Litomosoides sigmodontis TaxID=80850 RepID=UPI00158BBC26|nr:hypothetical protein [Wolbachia endosymbiont of Litomosoides sigmodontis]QKX03262.1 hypothetical protein GOY07_03815 [Wolbachia endosymbiont of Litomosoides sigmodontis]
MLSLRNEDNNQGKFDLSISKSTAHLNMQKMLYITPRLTCNEQDKGGQEELKKLDEIISKYLKKSYFSLMNCGLAHIQKLDTGD